MASQRSLLVIGGGGQLGDAVVSVFKNHGWTVISADYSHNYNASQSIKFLDGETSSVGLAKFTKAAMTTAKVDTVVCTAGGWAGGDLDTEGGLNAVDDMLRVNAMSAALSVHLASCLLKESGLVVLTGAKAACGPTPGMIGYGMSKAATHKIVESSTEGVLPEGSTIAAVLPTTIDTSSNRAGMPDADFSSWTPAGEISAKILSWCDSPPPNGSMWEPRTADNVTEWVRAHHEE